MASTPCTFFFLAFLLFPLLFTPSFCSQLQDSIIETLPPVPSFDYHLSSVMASLGYHRLASAVSSLADSSLLSAWSLPTTVFAPADDTIDKSTFLINEHTVAGTFTFRFLSKLKSGTVLETMSSGRCLTFTFQDNATAAILVNSVPIVQPDIYNDGLLVVHGIQAPIAPLSLSSCELLPTAATGNGTTTIPNTTADAASWTRGGDLDTPTVDVPVVLDPYAQPSTTSVMSLMLRHAMLSLRENGYSILALAMRIKYNELVHLHNMTVFALDDSAIFSGGHAYVNNVRFHVVPNRLLTHADLLDLPLGTVLPTLARGERLLVTSAGTGVRINYVPIRSPEVLYNLNIVVHSIFLPFPHLANPSSVCASLGNAAFQAPEAAPQGEVPRGIVVPGPSPAGSYLEDDLL